MTPSEQIDRHIQELNDWRGKMISKLRKIIHEADPEIVEEWKWGSPIFSHSGMVTSIGSFKDHVKMHFFQGANVKDEHNLFNAGLDAKKMRAIDFTEDSKIDESKLKDLIKAAVEYNTSK